MLTSSALPTAQYAATVESEPAVVLHDVTKRFAVRRRFVEAVRHPRSLAHIRVVQGVSCEIRAGEFFGLLGPNGAGKTTLFKMLATLVTPDSGRITVHGHDVNRDTAQIRRLLAPVIADERSLHWRLSGTENLRLFAALHGLRGAALRRRVDQTLEIVQLIDARNRMAGTYSSGMRQRLLIARALLSSPRVLLLDEPTRSLDPVSARNFRRFLKEEMVARSGCTVLLATHSADEAFDLCTRVAILDKGRMLATGRTDELVREFADDRYRVWTLAPAHPAWVSLVERGTVRALGLAPPDGDPWAQVEFELPGGPAAVASVIRSLSDEGVPIGRFERIPLSLADLLERVVQARGSDSSGGAHERSNHVA